jgi:hypothetical protein
VREESSELAGMQMISLLRLLQVTTTCALLEDVVNAAASCSSSNSRPAVSCGTATAAAVAAAASRPILHLWQNIIMLMLQLAQDLQQLLLLLPTIEALLLHLQLPNAYAPNVVKLSPLLKFLSFTKSRAMLVSEQHLGLQVLELFVPNLLKSSSDDLATYFSLQIRLQNFEPFCCLFCS